MTEIAQIAVTIALILGALFVLVGSYGLVKLDRPMSRLHAPTKAGTLGVGSILMASMINSFVRGDGSLHELLIMAFIFVTAPVSAYFISKVHIHRDRNIDPLPRPPADRVWATKDLPGDRDRAG
ncbi:Na+/H+ antiporter subunit G [Histidinibacterium aquaticum]|uniref:Na+/H+ antiporter subunit G n=1 Tax=Histidinibacterium aquaticum TaxID=2613962 RepID=A0A5J5GPT4_9RHOB|nr:Na+/H+ antiporter subunit G [Histidinibacterium aquaticum]KAA9010180.1 Na+/H+ antiporter subunit G [Histidinibacterium aquaticum]